MGIKASTANGGQSPRTRTFSTSSSSDVVSGGTGFNILRAIPGINVATDSRQRARSLSSVQGNSSYNNHDGISISPVAGPYDISASPETDSSSAEDAAASLALAGRVYTATSLPAQIWSLNGIKCPVCSKFVMPDDIECHLVMCLTKPRLSYNEDCLTDAKGECVICLEDLCPGDIIARLPCLCIYHKGCIDKWFEVNRSCPEHPGD
uniref:E3 ubiquitin-protein ligase ZNRF1 n=1 Tax=Corethrella appendiculata TaxID=1370023 RepID=U5EPP5_9DIPT